MKMVRNRQDLASGQGVEKAREPLMALAEQHVATITRGPGEGSAALGPWHPEMQAGPSAH